MKTEHAIALGDYILDHKTDFANRSGTWAEHARRVSEEVGFEVKESQLRDCLKARGIETKRMSEREKERMSLLSENERLQAENNDLRRTLAKVAASEYVPDDFKEFVFAGLNDEVKAAILGAAKCTA